MSAIAGGWGFEVMGAAGGRFGQHVRCVGLCCRVPCPALWREPVHFKRLPACQTILNVIGNFLADGCQVEQFLFAEDIFGSCARR